MTLIYDPLGIIYPRHISEKVIYRELCDEKSPWDAEAPEHLKNKFVKWVRDISSLKNEKTRSVTLNKEPIIFLSLVMLV